MHHQISTLLQIHHKNQNLRNLILFLEPNDANNHRNHNKHEPTTNHSDFSDSSDLMEQFNHFSRSIVNLSSYLL